MERAIVLFPFYSSTPIRPNCFLSMRDDIVYRNMFLLPCGDGKIHFEFPMFEDHTYNTICNRKGMRSLIQQPITKEKYIIFFFFYEYSGECIIIGFYKVRKAYYQETRMFNNYGFVWGIEAEPHLIYKGLIKCNDLGLGRNYRTSWHSEEWSNRLNAFLDDINVNENVSDLYQSETNRLVELFKDQERVIEWQQNCTQCAERTLCSLHRKFRSYNKNHSQSDMFSVLNYIYNSNIYSRNVLNHIPKIYLK